MGAELLLERAVDWARGEERVAALVVHGSMAKGTADRDSDLDLVVVARPGAREALWEGRAGLAALLLDGEPVWSQELPWQRPFRYQAWRDDLQMLDLTLDEGAADAWAS